MGCSFEVLLPGRIRDAVAAAETALDEVARLDNVLSVYRPDSEVSRLNAAAGSGPRPAGEAVLDLLDIASRLARENDGALDVALEALVHAWGLDRGNGTAPSGSRLAAARQRSGIEHVHVDRARRTVALAKPGVGLNFGAIGKGYALDRAAALLRDRWQIPSALLHGGTSSVCAIGCCPGESKGWMIGLRDPEDESQPIAAVFLRDQGLATSAITRRFVESGGRRWGHILDPRSGHPADGPRSVTVVAPTAAEADALATTFFVLGPAAAARYAASRRGIGAIFLPAAERGPVACLVGDLEPEFAPDIRVERVPRTPPQPASRD